MGKRPFQVTLIALVITWHVPVTHAASDEQHKEDVEALRRWWTQIEPGIPAQRAERLHKWVEEHPDDGESLFLLSQIEERIERRNPRGPRKSVDLLRRAAATGYPAAMARLGWHMITGKSGVPVDRAGGMKLVRNAVDKDDAEGHATLGIVLSQGLHGGNRDPKGALHHFERAATQGIVKAWTGMWLVYEGMGRGAEGIPLLRKGADAGEPYASLCSAASMRKADTFRGTRGKWRRG